MDEYKLRIIQVKESILEDNDADADKLREELSAEKTFYINVMSSPGSGKTSSILQLIARLRDEFRMSPAEAKQLFIMDYHRVPHLYSTTGSEEELREFLTRLEEAWYRK